MAEGGVLRQVVALFGVQWDKSAQKQVSNGIDGLANQLQGLGKWVASAFAVHQVKHFVETTIQVGDQIQKAAIRIGISGDELEQWNYIATRSGVSAETLQFAFAKMQRSAFLAANGTKINAAAFRALGVSVKDSSGQLKKPNQLFIETADALSSIENPTQKVAVAQAIFGRGAAQLIPLINEGASGIEELKKRFEEIGGGFAPEFFGHAEEAQDAIEDWEASLTSLKSAVIISILPSITRFFSSIATGVGQFSKMIAHTNAAKAALLTIGSITTVLALKLAAPFILPTLLIAAIILLVDELITTFEGGDTIIRRFIDGMFGVGTTANVVLTLKQAWEGLLLTIQAVADSVQNLFHFVSSTPVLRDLWKRTAVGKAVGTVGAAPTRHIPGTLGLTDGQITAGVQARVRAQNAANLAQTTNNHSTVINVNGAGDPAKVAKEVVRAQELERRRVAQALIQEVEPE